MHEADLWKSIIIALLQCIQISISIYFDYQLLFFLKINNFHKKLPTTLLTLKTEILHGQVNIYFINIKIK